MSKFGVYFFLAGALVLSGCGSYGGGGSNYGGNNTPPGTITYNETLNTGDSFNDQILRFGLTVSSVVFNGMSPTANTSNLLSQPARIEFVHQAGTFEPLALENIPAGTYTSAIFTVSTPNVVVLNGGAPASVTANLAATMVTANFNSAITVSSSSIATINFDLDLVSSVTLNGSPVTSATVSPHFNVTTSPITAGSSQDVNSGQIEALHGTLTNISGANFNLQTVQGTIPFMVTTSTSGGYGGGGGGSPLSGFQMGDIVEVDATTNSDGTKLATAIAKDASTNGQEAEGIVASVTGSPATLITIADQLDSFSTATAPTTVNALISTTTAFAVRSDKLNILSFPLFDSTHIGKGQRVEADSTSAGFPTIATTVKLREQALVGTVAASPAPMGSSFMLTLNPASALSTLTGTTSVAVTVASGATMRVTPVAGASLLVRGLVFVNGSTYTMIATRDTQN